MGFVRRGGGGGGGDEGGGSDEELGTAHKRCAVCRRELLPWQPVCPDDGGAAVEPGTLGSGEHDALLARLLAEDDADDADPEPEEDATDPGPGGDDPVWPPA